MAEMMHTESGGDAGGTGLESAVEAGRKRPRRDRRKPVDGRTRAARRLVELTQSYLSDLQSPSQADQALARQAAALTVESERLAERIVRGEAICHEQAVRLSNALARSLNALNRRSTGRRKKPAGLAEYLSGRKSEGRPA